MFIRISYSPVPDLIDTLHAENNNDKLLSDTNIKYVLYSPVTISGPLILVAHELWSNPLSESYLSEDKVKVKLSL
jgi:hypothetical protein